MTYRDWEIAQGIPERDAIEATRQRDRQRADAHTLRREADSFDSELFFGSPSYGDGSTGSSYVGRNTGVVPATSKEKTETETGEHSSTTPPGQGSEAQSEDVSE